MSEQIRLLKNLPQAEKRHSGTTEKLRDLFNDVLHVLCFTVVFTHFRSKLQKKLDQINITDFNRSTIKF